LGVDINVQIFREWDNSDKDKVHDYMHLVNSSIDSEHASGSNLAVLSNLLLVQPKSTVQINLDSCHFWLKENTATSSSLIECISDFSFSVYRYLSEKIVESITRPIASPTSIEVESGDEMDKKTKKKNKTSASIYFYKDFLMFLI